MNEKEEKALSAFEQGRTVLGEAKAGEVPRDVAGELLTVSVRRILGRGRILACTGFFGPQAMWRFSSRNEASRFS